MDKQKFSEFESFFHPRSVAIVGATRKTDWMWVRCFTHGAFHGRVYPVNPKEKSILGLRCYASLMDIPDEVDYVINAVPANVTPCIIEDCVRKGVKVVSVFTSGFSETGTEAGRKLEEEIVRIARKGSLRIVGPNCMGFHCPESGITFRNDLSMEWGSVGFVSQSGGNAIRCAMVGMDLGIKYSKIVSYGNACDLNESDFIEYLAEDPKTKIITAYLEGTRDGRRLFETLREAAKKKPVIVCKGGRTERGARAVASHTGAVSGERRVWDAMLKQADAVQVKDWVELSNTTLAFLNSPVPKGRRVGIVTISGGSGVANTDTCTEAGLDVHPLSQRTVELLLSKIHRMGTNVKNPVDLAIDYINMGIIELVLDSLMKDENIDAVIFESTFHDMVGPRWMTDIVDEMRSDVIGIGRRQRSLGKPFIVVVPRHLFEDRREKDRRAYLDARIPVYPDIVRAAEALRNLCSQ